MTRRIYIYGEKGNIFKKVKQITELINEILIQLILNVNSNFTKTYNISSLKFVDKTILEIPEIERDLIIIKKK